MQEILEKISKIGLVPVVKIDRAEDAVSLGKALCEGGLPCAEITFRTKAAKEAIKNMSEAFPEMLIGAGTVLTPEQADEAMEAGATFIVSPGLNPEVVKHCLEKKYPIVPGVCTPSDIEKALSLGLSTVKFFPAEAAGGVGMIKAMSAPYGNVTFLPTGGVNAENLNSYLSNPKVLACGGSFMVPSDAINEGDFEKIKKLTENAVMTMLGFRFKHMGINTESREEAEKTADLLGTLFGFEKDVRSKSFFASPAVEIMNYQGMGKLGHIAIGTNSVDRAVFYLSSKGVKFDGATARYDEKGKLKFIYLADEIAGFAVHLVRN